MSSSASRQAIHPVFRTFTSAEQTTSLTEALEDTSKLPWEILHIAQISLEVRTALELSARLLIGFVCF